MPSGIPYKVLQTRHPDHLPEYWAKCRALYAGGRKLLCANSVMNDVYPKHNAENPALYKERCHRAYYLNYAGSVIDLIVAGLFEESPSAEGSPEPDKWYSEWFKDVSRPGGRVMSFVDLLKTQILTALCLKRSWTLVDLPAVSPEMQAANIVEQEQSGALGCYAVPVDPECVRDWECDDDGALLWVLLAFKRQQRQGIEGDRKTVQEEYVYYTPDAWQRYAIEYREDRPPNDKTVVPLVAEGQHTFGRVPLSYLEVTDGMWAMGKLESVAVAHMNTINALSWATFKSLFPTRTAFLDKEEIGNEITEDMDRAKNQPIGPSMVNTFGANDRIEYPGPSPEPFKHALEQADRLRDEMYRVVHSMAASVDNSGAALQRSGESKSMDLRHTATVLKWLGQRVAEHAVEVLQLVGCGRGDPEVEWQIHGMEEFDAPDPAGMLAEAQIVSTLDLNSPTFQALYKFKVAKALTGDDADGEDLDKMQTEFEQNNPPEEFNPEDRRRMAMETAQAMTPDSPGNPDDDDDEEDTAPDKETPKKPEKGKKKPAKKAEKKAA